MELIEPCPGGACEEVRALACELGASLGAETSSADDQQAPCLHHTVQQRNVFLPQQHQIRVPTFPKSPLHEAQATSHLLPTLFEILTAGLARQGLYLLLVTNKASNILEDLETLRLLAKVAPPPKHPCLSTFFSWTTTVTCSPSRASPHKLSQLAACSSGQRVLKGHRARAGGAGVCGAAGRGRGAGGRIRAAVCL